MSYLVSLDHAQTFPPDGMLQLRISAVKCTVIMHEVPIVSYKVIPQWYVGMYVLTVPRWYVAYTYCMVGVNITLLMCVLTVATYSHQFGYELGSAYLTVWLMLYMYETSYLGACLCHTSTF